MTSSVTRDGMERKTCPCLHGRLVYLYNNYKTLWWIHMNKIMKECLMGNPNGRQEEFQPKEKTHMSMWAGRRTDQMGWMVLSWAHWAGPLGSKTLGPLYADKCYLLNNCSSMHTFETNWLNNLMWPFPSSTSWISTIMWSPFVLNAPHYLFVK